MLSNINCGRRWYPLSPAYVSEMYTSLVQVTMRTYSGPMVPLLRRVAPIITTDLLVWKNVVASRSLGGLVRRC